MSVFAEFLGALPFMNEARVELVSHAFLPILKAAVTVSLPLTLGAFIFGVTIAIAVAFARALPPRGVGHRLLLMCLRAYVSMIRGTPMLVQLFVVFYGLPALGIYVDPIPAAMIAFSLNIGAYASETMRGAISSVPLGQWESAFTLGMSHTLAFRRIVFPQALRVAVPPLSNTFVSLFKETSLASMVTVTEMFRVAQQEANRSYDFLPIYIEVALIYWCFCMVFFAIQKRLEQALSRYLQPRPA